jgi:subtilisin family serine protease
MTFRVRSSFLRTRLAALAPVAAVLVVGAATPVGAHTGPARTGGLAALVDGDRPTTIAGSYVVVLKREAGTAGRARSLGARVDAEYRHALKGFSAHLDAAQLEALRSDPDVDYIAADQEVTASAGTQSGATWGIDRIDQKARPLSTTYTYDNTASNVTAYIIDTGIKYTHNDFGGRARVGYDAVGSGGVDCNGHGTHVAGTVGGATYGVAKAVKLVGVRVLNCSGSGTNAGVIAGVNWVTQNAVKPAVANMSLGGGVSTALDNAVANSISSGVTYALAAGNSTANACDSSPSRVASAITVGATTSTDARASYSNYGTCLDIFAPGSAITSDWYSSDTATNSISGTSMASPHVAGAAALVLAGSPSLTPAQVRDNLVNKATTGVVTSPGTGSPNRLLYVGS